MNIYNNYSLANCTKNFITFCAKFLLTRKIICAILEPQRETNGQANKPERKKGKWLLPKWKSIFWKSWKKRKTRCSWTKKIITLTYSWFVMIWGLLKNSKAETPKGVTVNRPTRSDDGRARQKIFSKKIKKRLDNQERAWYNETIKRQPNEPLKKK